MCNTGTVTFLNATEQDLAAMLALYNEHIVNTTATFDYEEIGPEEFKSRISFGDDRCQTFCAYIGGEWAGFCFLTPFNKKTAYDKTVEIGLYLKRPFTGRGYGGQIVAQLESAAKAAHFEMIVASVSGENLPSIKLFKKLGYAQCAHYKQIAVKFGRKQDILDFQKAI